MEWFQGYADFVSTRAEIPNTDSMLTRPNRADASIGGEATGAMSWAFITSLRKNPNQSYVQLLNSIRDELEGNTNKSLN